MYLSSNNNHIDSNWCILRCLQASQSEGSSWPTCRNLYHARHDQSTTRLTHLLPWSRWAWVGHVFPLPGSLSSGMHRSDSTPPGSKVPAILSRNNPLVRPRLIGPVPVVSQLFPTHRSRRPQPCIDLTAPAFLQSAHFPF